MAPQPPTLPTAVPASLLTLIVDVHPISWSLLSTPIPISPNSAKKAPVVPLQIDEIINILIVFINAHLASGWGNQVVVYGASAGRSKLLYPSPTSRQEVQLKSNLYEGFRVADDGLDIGLKKMVREEAQRVQESGGQGLHEQPAIVSAMTKALSYINRVVPKSAAAASASSELDNIVPPDQIEPRIMVINASPQPAASVAKEDPQSKGAGSEMRGGYVGLMNCVFAAQKAKVPIDVLTLPPPSSGAGAPIFLQQAAYLTEGIYWRWNGRGALLQYLHSIYLAPPSLRNQPFAVLPQDAVDFRAVCFCHQDVVEVGYVCSVCLSIFCRPVAVCGMCSTRFPVKSLVMLKSLGADIEPIPVPNTVVPIAALTKNGNKAGVEEEQ